MGGDGNREVRLGKYTLVYFVDLYLPDIHSTPDHPHHLFANGLVEPCGTSIVYIKV